MLLAEAGPKILHYSLPGTYQSMCGLVGVDVVKDSGHTRKQRQMRVSMGVHKMMIIM